MRPLLAMLLWSTAACAADAQQVKNLLDPKLREQTIRGRDVTPGCPVDWSVRVTTLHGGRQEGSQLIVLDNGKMQITVVPTRGLGILRVQLGDLRLGWDSPVQEVVHPSFINPLARGGLGWLEGFNEWLCRCGLENCGQPGKDEFINNVGDKATMDLTLHGKIANIPASVVELSVEPAAPYRLTLRGLVEERMLFGPKLQLQAELSTEPGATSFRLKDTVVNRGAQPQEFQMLYHLNYGTPLLEQGARLVTPVRHVRPYNARAAQDVKSWNEFAGPKAGYIEQVYLLQPLADASGQALVLLQNRAHDKGASLRYAVKDLPYLTLWKNTGDPADGYVIGVEPGTSYPNNRRVEREHGRVPVLAAGASRTMTLDFGLHQGREAVQRLAEEVQQIQRSAPAIVDTAPQGK
jgi:hypothetical protein